MLCFSNALVTSRFEYLSSFCILWSMYHDKTSSVFGGFFGGFFWGCVFWLFFFPLVNCNESWVDIFFPFQNLPPLSQDPNHGSPAFQHCSQGRYLKVLWLPFQDFSAIISEQLLLWSRSTCLLSTNIGHSSCFLRHTKKIGHYCVLVIFLHRKLLWNIAGVFCMFFHGHKGVLWCLFCLFVWLVGWLVGWFFPLEHSCECILQFKHFSSYPIFKIHPKLQSL